MRTKITLLATGLLLFSDGLWASKTSSFDANSQNSRFVSNYGDINPIEFVERGVAFYVFLDGEFDFNTQPNASFYKNSNENRTRNGRTTNTRTLSFSNTYYGTSSGIRIEHDYMGRVRRVGNVFINYDAFGRVKRIGSVYMRYNSFALKQVGGLRIIYNRRGQIIDIVGFVNNFNSIPNYNFNGNGHNFNESPITHDDFYYYKKDGTKTKMNADDISEIRRDENERTIKK